MPPFNPLVFRARLRDARTLCGLTQANVAKKAGLPSSAISHFESGNRLPSLEKFFALAEALHVSTDFLLGRSRDAQHMSDDGRYIEIDKLTDEHRETVLELAKVLNRKRRS